MLIFVAVQYRAERDQAREVVEEGYQQRLYEAQEHLQAIDLKLTKAGVASGARHAGRAVFRREPSRKACWRDCPPCPCPIMPGAIR